MVWNRLLASALACAVLMSTGVVAAGATGTPQESKPTAVQSAPINLNVATSADLQKLPGVGAAMAARILEYRQKSGGFKKIEELMNVTGIGEKNFLRLKPLVTVAPPKTIER